MSDLVHKSGFGKTAILFTVPKQWGFAVQVEPPFKGCGQDPTPSG